MRFEVIGSREKPVILMMGWPFSTPACLRPAAEKLQDFCVILPCWDGEDDSKVAFTGRQDQAAQILSWLQQQEIRQVAVLVGISMGAAVAMDLASLMEKTGMVQPGAILCDSGTFRRRGWITRILRSMAVRHMMRLRKKGTEEEAVSAMLQSRAVRLLTGRNAIAFLPLLTDMVHIADKLSGRTIRAQQKACCTFDWPQLSEALERRTVFTYASDDPSRFALRQLREQYPRAVYHTFGKLGHGGMVLRNTDSFVSLVRGLTLK